MEIQNSTLEDLDIIFDLYEHGTAHQKLVGIKHWLGFDKDMVRAEIKENRQYKIVEDGQIACVFVITTSDPEIWEEKNADPAVYLHRIATHEAFRGNSYVKNIVAWARAYAKANQKLFIRMDTGSGNDRLNNYYISCGFNYLGVKQLSNTENLPAHYKQGSFSLFEISLAPAEACPVGF